MKTSFKLRSTACFLITLASGISFAGGMEGGGGKSVVCRNADGSIKSAEVLDLYEGRVQYGLKYAESPLSANEQVLQIMHNSKISTGHSMPRSSIFDWYSNALEHLQFVPIGTDLIPINDSLEVIAPKNCTIEQTINYQNDQLILVNTEIWNAFTETQRAGILLHEAVYRHLRYYGETDSRRSRHFTSYLFAGGKVEQTYPGNDYTAICSNSDRSQPSIAFYITKPFLDEAGREQVRLHFTKFGGRHLMTKSYIDIANTSETNTLPSFYEFIKNNEVIANMTFQGFSTISSFEGGDLFNIIFRNENSTKKIYYEGVSSIDNKIHGSELNCR